MASIGKSLLIFTIGAAAGATAGLLMAPSSGKQLRGDISKKGKHYLDEIESSLNEGVATVRNSAQAAKSKVDSAVEKLNKVVSN